jgi:hypothetical protein
VPLDAHTRMYRPKPPRYRGLRSLTPQRLRQHRSLVCAARSRIDPEGPATVGAERWLEHLPYFVRRRRVGNTGQDRVAVCHLRPELLGGNNRHTALALRCELRRQAVRQVPHRRGVPRGNARGQRRAHVAKTDAYHLHSLTRHPLEGWRQADRGGARATTRQCRASERLHCSSQLKLCVIY